MAEYNASDLKDIRKAKRAAKAAQAERSSVILSLMSSSSGRGYMYDRLLRCHIFSTTFSPDPYASAFNEGQRNVGLQDLNDLMQFAPDQYITMMREATDRNTADGRRTDDNNRSNGDSQNDGRDDSGSDSGSGDYDPIRDSAIED